MEKLLSYQDNVDPENENMFDKTVRSNSFIDKNRNDVKKAIQNHKSMQALRKETRKIIEHNNP